jgi:hypothetical protein
MSQVANKMSNNNNYNNAKKPFCKVCFDAGKADTAHFIRKTPDPKSQVTCPTLLALECRYCFQHGHTVKYCTVLQKQDKDKDRDIKHKKIIGHQTPTLTPTLTKNSNQFAAFEDEDDLEQLQQQLPTLATQTLTKQLPTLAIQDNLQFPTLNTLATQTNLNTTINTTTTNKWAAMASVAANKPIPIIYKPITIIKQQGNTNTKWADDDELSVASLEDNLSFADDDVDEYHACPVQPVANTYTYANTYTPYSANDDDW